jgi:hypothetical protein
MSLGMVCDDLSLPLPAVGKSRIHLWGWGTHRMDSATSSDMVVVGRWHLHLPWAQNHTYTDLTGDQTQNFLGDSPLSYSKTTRSPWLQIVEY